MKKREKKALSPVITTVMLILMAIVIAVMIIVWAKEFNKESLRKFDQPIEDICSEINFNAEIQSSTEISIVNIGEVPIFRLDVVVEGESSEILSSGEINVEPGVSSGFTLDQSIEGYKLKLIPIILGESSDKTASPYKCNTASKDL
jgi:flagellin-like protein